ncbi:hypothetical protein OAJ07_04410 [Gemmatimonadales bacterium]|jgi:hypothetical protein|nr:hypothetical protein [Gemmatimonadales bacterium]
MVIETNGVSENKGTGWRRLAVLFTLLMLSSLVPAGMLVGVPFLILIGLSGIRSPGIFIGTVAAMFVVLAGQRDSLWYMERGWAVLLGGFFAAVTLVAPRWRLTSKSLAAVGAALLGATIFCILSSGAWENLEWSVNDRLAAVLGNFLYALELVTEGQSVSPAFIAAVNRTVELQAAVFPAVLALQSMAALGVAWWLYRRLGFGDDQALASVRYFGFNDHLVWILITGLLLVFARLGDSATRIGANLALFMTTLYALRGVGVVAFVSEGLTFLGLLMLLLGVLFAAPILVGFAALLGIADTWLDLRTRAEVRAS